VDKPWRKFVADHCGELRAVSRREQLLGKRLVAFARSCRSDVARLDLALVRSLRRLEGDEQGAAATERVHRRPGVLLAVEVPDLVTARQERIRMHPYLRGAAFVPAAPSCDDLRRLALFARPSQDRPWQIRRSLNELVLLAPRPELVPLARQVAEAGTAFLGRGVTAASAGGSK